MLRPSRLEGSAFERLCGAWGTCSEVVITWDGGTVRGFVENVAPTGAFAMVWDGRQLVHVPLCLLPSVMRPHYTMGKGPLPRRLTARPLALAGQLELF